MTHAIVDGTGAAAVLVYVATMWPLKDRRNFSVRQAQDIGAATIQVVRLGGGKVNRLTGTRGVVFSHRQRALGHGQDGRVHHTCPAIAQGGG